MEWKRRAFSDVLDAAFEYDEGRRGAGCVEVNWSGELLIQFQGKLSILSWGSRPNVISIGDSVYEQAALAFATKRALVETSRDWLRRL